MSASTGKKVVAGLVFILIGLPAGLCTIVGVPSIIFSLFMMSQPHFEMTIGQILGIGVITLIEAVIAYFVIRWVAGVFRQQEES